MHDARPDESASLIKVAGRDQVGRLSAVVGQHRFPLRIALGPVRENSGGLLPPPSPPAEKATARQDQAGLASIDDGGENAWKTRLWCPKAKAW